MEAKTNIRRLLAGSSFLALLAASDAALAAGTTYNSPTGVGAQTLTTSTDYILISDPARIFGDLTIAPPSGKVQNTTGAAGVELSGGSIYGSIVNNNQIKISTNSTGTPVGILAHAGTGFGFVTGNIENNELITVTGENAAAGIIVFGNGVSIGGAIENNADASIIVKASQSAQSGIAAAAGIFVDVPTVYGDVANSGLVKVNATEQSLQHHVRTTNALAEGKASAIASGVGAGGGSSFQGLISLSEPILIDGSVTNAASGVMLIKAHALATHTAIANGSGAGFGYATAEARGTTLGADEAHAQAYGVFATGAYIDGDVGNYGSAGAIAAATVVNNAEAHGVHGFLNVIGNGNARATASGNAGATAEGAGAAGGTLTGGTMTGSIFNDGTLGAGAYAVAKNNAEADTSAGTNAAALARGTAHSTATGLYNYVASVGGSFVNGTDGEILARASSIASNTASVIDPTHHYVHATADAVGGGWANAFGMRAEDNSTITGNTISGGLINTGFIHASAVGKTVNTATVQVKGSAVAHAYGTEDGGANATAIGIVADVDSVGGISYGHLFGGPGITAQAIASANDHAKATGQSFAAADAQGDARAQAAGTSTFVTFLGNGYVNNSGVTVSALGEVLNQATATLTGASLGAVHANASGNAYGEAYGLNPNFEYVSGDFVNATGGSLGVHAQAHVANSAFAGGTSLSHLSESGATVYGTAHAVAYGIQLGDDTSTSINGDIRNFGQIDVTASAAVTNVATAAGQNAQALAHDGHLASQATAVGFGADIVSLNGSFQNTGDITAIATVRPSDKAVAHGTATAVADVEGAGLARATGISLGGYTGSAIGGQVSNGGNIGVLAVVADVNLAQADATHGPAFASLAGHAAASAAGLNINAEAIYNGVVNDGDIQVGAVAADLNGTLLSGLLGGGISELAVNPLSFSTGFSFGALTPGGATASGTSLAHAVASGSANAGAIGFDVNANSIGGGVANNGGIGVLALALTTNEAAAHGISHGLAQASASGLGAHASGAGFWVNADDIYGGVSNTSNVGVFAVAGSVNDASAQGTSLGLSGTIDASAQARGSAIAYGVGVAMSVTSLFGSVTNYGDVLVVGAAGVFNHASALASNGNATASAIDQNLAYARATGVSIGIDAVLGDITNWGDISVYDVVGSLNHATAAGTSFGHAVHASALAVGSARADATGLSIGVGSISGSIKNSGDVGVLAMGIVQDGAKATGESHAFATVRNYGQADALGIAVYGHTIDGQVSNSGDVTVQAHVSSAAIGLADATGGDGYTSVAGVASLSGRVEAHAGGIDIGADTILGGIVNEGDIQVTAVAGSFNGSVLSDLLEPESEGGFIRNPQEWLSGQSFALLGLGGATAYGTSLAQADVHGQASANAHGIEVNGYSVNGGIANSGSIGREFDGYSAGVRAFAITTNEAKAFGSVHGTANATANGFGARAHGTGISIGVVSVGGNITNTSFVGVQAIAGSVNVAEAQGTSLGLAGTINSHASAVGSAHAYGRGIHVNVSSLFGSISNSADVQVTAAAGVFNHASAMSPNGTAGAQAADGLAASAVATGLSFGINSVFGDVANSGDILVHSSAASINSATAGATGLSLGQVTRAVAGAYGSASARGFGFKIDSSSIYGGISNSGQIEVFSGAVASDSAHATGVMALATAENRRADASATGLSIHVGSIAGGVLNTARITAVAHAQGSNEAYATGSSYVQAKAEGTANAYAKGIDYHGVSVGLVNGYDDSFRNTGAIDVQASAWSTNTAVADAAGAFGSAQANSSANAYGTGIRVSANTLTGGFFNSGQIFVSVAGSAVNAARATGTSLAQAQAFGSATAEANGISLGHNYPGSLSIGGDVTNIGGIAAFATAFASNTAVANGNSAVAYAGATEHGSEYNDADASAVGVDVNIDTLSGRFTNSGNITALAYATSFSSAKATGGSHGYAWATAGGDAQATGIDLYAGSVGGSVSNSGRIDVQASIVATAIAEAKAPSALGHATAYASGSEIEASATGFYYAGNTLAGSFVNSTGGSMWVHATAGDSLSAKATGQSYAYASADLRYYMEASAYGIAVTDGVSIGGDFSNGASLSVRALSTLDAKATAEATGASGIATAKAVSGDIESFATGIYADLSTLDGDFTNSGVLNVNATAQVATFASAIGAGGATAYAGGYATADATGIDFNVNSMGGNFVNEGAITVTAKAAASSQAIAKASDGEGTAYGSNEGTTEAHARATGISAYFGDSLGGNFDSHATIHAHASATAQAKASATGVSGTYAAADGSANAHALGIGIGGDGASFSGHVENNSLIDAFAKALATATMAAMGGFAAASATARATGISIGGLSSIAGSIRNVGDGYITANAHATAAADASNGVDRAEARANAIGLGANLSGSLGGGFFNSGTIRANATAKATGVSFSGAGASLAIAHASATGASLNVGEGIEGGVINEGTIVGNAYATATGVSFAHGYANAHGLTVNVYESGISGGISNSGSILAHAVVNASPVTPDVGRAYATGLYVRVEGNVTGVTTSLYNSGSIRAIATDPLFASAKGVVLEDGAYSGNLNNVGSFSTEDGVHSFHGGVISAQAHTTSNGYAQATALLLKDYPVGAASFSGALLNSGLIIATAKKPDSEIDTFSLPHGAENHATAIKLEDGAYFEDGIVNEGVIEAIATGDSMTAVAINADQAGRGMLIQQLGQLDHNSKVFGGIYGEIKTNNGYNDQINWTGGQIIGDIHGDTGDSLTVFAGLGYTPDGAQNFVYDNNINTHLVGETYVNDGQSFGGLSVNTGSDSDPAVSLKVSGNMFLGDLNVNHNGTLILDPTAQIQTTNMTIQGTGSPAGTVQWNIQPTFPQYAVITAGQVNIGEGANSVAYGMPGLFAKNNDFWVIHTNDLTGQFSDTDYGTVTPEGRFLNGLYTITDEYVDGSTSPTDPLYGKDGYHIVVTRISFGSIPGMTEDGTNFGNYLDRVLDYLTEHQGDNQHLTDLADLLGQILTGTPEEYGHAVNELSGHQNADMLLAALGDPSQLMDVIFGQLGGAGFGGGGVAELGTLVQLADNSVSAIASDAGPQYAALGGVSPVDKPTTVWARAFGNWSSLDSNAGIGAAGFDSSGGGVVVGGDYKFTDNFKAGLAAGYQKDKIDFHLNAGDADVTSWSLSAYARADQGPLYVDGLAGYAHQDYSLNRHYQPIVPGPVYTANRDPNGNAVYAGAEVGYDFDLGNTSQIEPFLGFLYGRTDVDGSTETGSGPANLTIDDQSADTASSRLGVRWSQTFGSAGGSAWTPMLELGWKHEFADTNPTTTSALAGIPGSSFTVQGAGAPKDSAMVGAGVTLQLSDAVDGTVQYNGDFSDKYQDSTASLRLRMKF